MSNFKVKKEHKQLGWSTDSERAKKRVMEVINFHNADHDIDQGKGAPDVEWSTWYIALAAEHLLDEIDRLWKRVRELEVEETE